MNLETRKIEFVQAFLKIQSEEVIARLEQILRKESKVYEEGTELKPMTVEEFNERIDKSMEDSKKGNVIKASDLKAKIDKWS
jgi:hypothetical protein